MCYEGLHDPFAGQVACARYRAERDALAQRMEEVASEIDRTLLGVEGIEDAPAMRWARGLREALGSLHAPRIGYEDIEAARWVRGHGGLDKVKRRYYQRPVLDADGEMLLRGETVYNRIDGEEYRVRGFVDDVLDVCVETAGGDAMTLCHDVLTHTKPEIDSWERIEEDATLGINSYRERYGIKKHDGMTWPQLVREDLVRRCKALAERERGE